VDYGYRWYRSQDDSIDDGTVLHHAGVLAWLDYTDYLLIERLEHIREPSHGWVCYTPTCRLEQQKVRANQLDRWLRYDLDILFGKIIFQLAPTSIVGLLNLKAGKANLLEKIVALIRSYLFRLLRMEHRIITTMMSCERLDAD
jgi:hypothetical protein